MIESSSGAVDLNGKVTLNGLLTSENPDRIQNSILGDAIDSAFYAGIQQPLDGITQLAGKVLGRDCHYELVKAPEQAEFGSASWHAQTIGGALGMLVPLLFTRSVRTSLTGVEATARASIGMRVREAALDGFICDTLFKPVDPQSEFFSARLRNGMVGSANFAALAASGAGLGVLGQSHRLKDTLVGALLRNSVSSGVISGIPAGLTSSGLNAIAHGQEFTASSVAKSMYEMAVGGGALGLKTWLPHEARRLHKDHGETIARVKESAGESWNRMVSEITQPMSFPPGMTPALATAGEAMPAWSRPETAGLMQAKGKVLSSQKTEKQSSNGDGKAEPKTANAVEAQAGQSYRKGNYKKAVELLFPNATAEEINHLAYGLNMIKPDFEQVRTLNLGEFRRAHKRLLDDNWSCMYSEYNEPLMSYADFARGQARSAVALTLTFGKEWSSWLALSEKHGKSVSTASWLADSGSRELGQIYMANVERPGWTLTALKEVWEVAPKDLKVRIMEQSKEFLERPRWFMVGLSKAWKDMAPELRPEPFVKLEEFIARKKYPRAGSGELAIAAANAAIEPKELYNLERRLAVVNDQTRPFADRLLLARELAEHIRTSDSLREVNAEMPPLRMPAKSWANPAEQAESRKAVENSLLEPKKVQSLFGDGPLGKLFPELFGREKSSIVGRDQGPGHEFSLDEHTARVVEQVRKEPQFAELPEKEKMNVLLAALLHDVGKRPGGRDAQHEWVSAGIAYGVLGTLGYEPQRIERITKLIARHGEVGYHTNYRPTSVLAPGKAVELKPTIREANQQMEIPISEPGTNYGLIGFYRRPGDGRLLEILNRADTKSIDGKSRLYTNDVDRELSATTTLLSQRTAELNTNAVPLLTSSLPGRFQMFKPTGTYVFLAHSSLELGANGTFLRQKATIESTEYTVSASLMSPRSLDVWGSNNKPAIVALLAAPAENIAQAYRRDLWSGKSSTYEDYIRQTRIWAGNNEASAFAQELNTKIRKARGSDGKSVKGLQDLYDRLSEFDTLDELRTKLGNGSAEHKAYMAVVEALTHEPDGSPLQRFEDGGLRPFIGSSEIKVNNPTIVGMGLVRRGLPIVFEQMSQTQLSTMVEGLKRPSWLKTASDFRSEYDMTRQSLVVPGFMWKEAQKQNLPFVVLE